MFQSLLVSTSSGAGSLYGTFGPARLLIDTDASTSGRRPVTCPSADSRRNIYVNPPHVGGPGRLVQDNTIGGTKFDHVPDEYCRGRRLEKVGGPHVGKAQEWN